MESLDLAELGKAFKQQVHRCKAILECNIKDELIMKAHHASRCAVSLLAKHKNCEETEDNDKKPDLLKKAMYNYSQSILDLTYFQECVQSNSDFADEASLDALSKIIHTLSLPAQAFKGSLEEGLVAVLGTEVLECLYWRVGAVLYMYCYSLYNKEERRKNMDVDKFLMCCCAGVGHLRLLTTARAPLGKDEDYVANDTDMVDLLEKGIFSDIHMLSLMYSGDMCYWAWSLTNSSPMVTTPIPSPVATPIATPTSSMATPAQSFVVTSSVSYVSSITSPISSGSIRDSSAESGLSSAESASQIVMVDSSVVLSNFTAESASRIDSSDRLSNLSAEFSSPVIKGDSSAELDSGPVTGSQIISKLPQMKRDSSASASDESAEEKIADAESATNQLERGDAINPSASFPTPPSTGSRRSPSPSTVSTLSSEPSSSSIPNLELSREKMDEASQSRTDLAKKDEDMEDKDADLANEDADVAVENSSFAGSSESPKTVETDFSAKDISSIDLVDMTTPITPAPKPPSSYSVDALSSYSLSSDSVDALSEMLGAVDVKIKEIKTLQHFPLCLTPASDVSDVSTGSVSSCSSAGSEAGSVFYVTRNSQLVEDRGAAPPGSLDLYHVMRHTQGEEAVARWLLEYAPLRNGLEMLNKYITAARGPLKAHGWDYSRAVDIMVKLKRAAASN